MTTVLGHEVRRRKLSAAGWEVFVDGVSVGRVGGREGHRWAQLNDGTLVTDDSPCSASTVLGVLVSAAVEAGFHENPVEPVDPPLKNYRVVGVRDNVFQAAPGAPKQPGGSCWHCGTGIMVEVVVQHATTGEVHTIGTTCAERVGLDGPELKRFLAEKFYADREARSAPERARRQAEFEAAEAVAELEHGPHGTAPRFLSGCRCDHCIAAAPHGTVHCFHFSKCRCLACCDVVVSEQDYEYREIPVLVDLSTGEIAPKHRSVDTRYGMKWVVDEKDGSTTWVPFNPVKRATQTKHGYVEAEAPYLVELCGARSKRWWKPVVAVGCPIIDAYDEPIVRPEEVL